MPPQPTRTNVYLELPLDAADALIACNVLDAHADRLTTGCSARPNPSAYDRAHALRVLVLLIERGCELSWGALWPQASSPIRYELPLFPAAALLLLETLELEKALLPLRTALERLCVQTWGEDWTELLGIDE